VEHLVQAMARAGRVRVVDETFEKDGKEIPFRRVHLAGGDGTITLAVRAGARKTARKERKERVRPRKGRRERGATTAGAAQLYDAIKKWRLGEAKRRGVPAFRILTDRALLALVAARPKSEAALLAVPGIGPGLASRFGAALLALVARG
jgi:DNA topoisomerase-3